jgi:uncharacterized membrane protein
MPPGPASPQTRLAGPELAIARLLVVGIDAAIVLMTIGTVLLLATGHSPLDESPTFDISAIPADLIALQPAGFLWLGILAVLATSVAQVAVALVGFGRRGDRAMALIAVGILAIIATGVLTGSLAP